MPLGTGTAGADGTLTSNVQVPDGLGGWHVIQLLQNGDGEGAGAVLRQAQRSSATASRSSG